MSAYGYGDGDPGLAKWIVQEAAGVPRKLDFRVLGRLFYIVFTPTPYTLEQSDEIDLYDSNKPQHEDEGDDSDDDQGGDPVYDKHERNEAAEGEQELFAVHSIYSITPMFCHCIISTIIINKITLKN